MEPANESLPHPEAPDPSQAPPLPEPESDPAPRKTSPVRWAALAVLLGSYPPLVGILSYLGKTEDGPPALVDDLGILILGLGFQLGFFALLCAIAWAIARPTTEQLYMRRDGCWPIVWRSALFSVGLRIGVTLIGLVAWGVGAAIMGGDPEAMKEFKPDIGGLVDMQALVDNPLFLLFNLTIVSFVVGGLSEEIWRAAMFAGLLGLAPRLAASWKYKWGIITIVAILFGSGHVAQGIGGMIGTFFLGLGLGWFMMWRRSLWETVMAHGLFNATSFALVYLVLRFAPEELEQLSFL